MSKLSDPWTARQQRHLTFILEFTTDIMVVSGKSNMVADCLSRAALSNVVLDIDYDAMAKAQKEDKDVKAFPTAITGLRIMLFPTNNSSLLCDVSTGQPRPLVPQSFQRHVIEAIHNLAHPGRKATVKLVSQRFVWHGLKKQVNQWAKECLACQQSKIQSHVHSQVVNIPVPAKRNLSPLPTFHHGLPFSSSVPQALFVFIRHNGHRGPLWHPYDGPFWVVASGDNTFCIMVGSREEVVSTDRLKAAHVDLTGPVTVAQPPRRGRPPLQQVEPAAQDKTPESAPPRQQPCLTCSGRAVHLPLGFR
ncbi:Pol polyprotein [Elysia marginata]|uniref:Pol polyprotein n=1 Tax=Elysia marginata TaxID=1093978 RepID=A0AAV4IJ07_9GAST|nr:Pol polyprotein [Elysia marginata]